MAGSARSFGHPPNVRPTAIRHGLAKPDVRFHVQQVLRHAAVANPIMGFERQGTLRREYLPPLEVSGLVGPLGRERAMFLPRGLRTEPPTPVTKGVRQDSEVMEQRPGLGIDQPPPVPFPDSAVLRTNTAGSPTSVAPTAGS